MGGEVAAVIVLSAQVRLCAAKKRFKLVGPTDAVLIVSDKARHYLLRKLCRLRNSMASNGVLHSSLSAQRANGIELR